MVNNTRSRFAKYRADFALLAIAITLASFHIFLGRTRNEGPLPLVLKAPAYWKSEMSSGIRLGPQNAGLIIVEFMDFQCPFCAAWAARVDSLMQEFPQDVQVTVHHYALAGHAHAIPAAIAAECAEAQGAFVSFQRAVFSQQEMFGQKAWLDFAVEAGIPDTPQFRQCLALPVDSFPRIAYGKQLGNRVRITGTPTVWVNGCVERPSLDRLRQLARAFSSAKHEIREELAAC